MKEFREFVARAFVAGLLLGVPVYLCVLFLVKGMESAAGLALTMSLGESRRLRGGALPAILVVLLVTLAGCRMTMPEHKVNTPIQPRKDIAVNQNQVRLGMRALVRPMCGELEQAADAIIAGTTNRGVQQAALRWKIEGVPALREALFQPDPFTAVSDTWVLCNQMADYFENGPGKKSLGAASAQAVAACRRMEEQFAQVAAAMTVSGDISKVRAFARKWAAEHPIRYSIAGRESTLSWALERDIADSFSIREEALELTITADDLNRKLSIYSDQLLRQARWEAELFKLELLEEFSANQAIPLAERAVNSAEQAVATMNRLAPAVERTLTVAENAPQLIASEREAVIKALQHELVRTLKFVQEERIAVLELVSRERIATLKELREDLVEEQKAMTRDLEQISLKVVDRAMWRVAQLVGVTAMVLAMAAVAGLFLVRRIFFRQ